MGDRGTFKPGDSMSSHSKDSMSIITRIVNASKESWKYIPEKDVYVDAGTFVDLDYRTLMTGFEHIRETIEEWEAMCDELDEDISALRKSVEILAGNCPYRNKYCDASDCAECEYAKKEMEIQLSIIEDRDHFRELAISRNNELEEEREKSNQLEKELSTVREVANQILEEKIKLSEDLRKECDSWEERCLHLKKRISQIVRNRDSVVDHWTKRCEHLLQKHRVELAAKDHEIWELQEQVEYWEDLAKKYADPDGHKLSPNNPCNFCGNCKYFRIHPSDVGVCERLKDQNKFKVVDPDDASCKAFESNNGVVIGKPEFPCCEHCSHEDCDNCNLCPF